MKYKKFQHKDCEWWGNCLSQSKLKEEQYNCLFCYCVFYHMQKCYGNPIILENGIKDCSQCNFTHNVDNYDKIINLIIENNKRG